MTEALNYDYIVVGAGTAGALMANRLSAGGRATVCVIEGGGTESAPNVTVPAGILSLGPRRESTLILGEQDA